MWTYWAWGPQEISALTGAPLPRNKRMMTDNNITLTETDADDLETLFQFQLDETANHLAAFTSNNPDDKAAYIEKKIRGSWRTRPYICGR